MTNYREILRLHSLRLNKTEIASSCRCARNTVAATLQRAANRGLQWPLPEEMSDSGLLGTEILVRMTQLTRSRCSITSSF